MINPNLMNFPQIVFCDHTRYPVLATLKRCALEVGLDQHASSPAEPRRGPGGPRHGRGRESLPELLLGLRRGLPSGTTLQRLHLRGGGEGRRRPGRALEARDEPGPNQLVRRRQILGVAVAGVLRVQRGNRW